MGVIHDVIDLDSVENDVVRAGVGYWRRLKGAREFPSSRQLSPREIGGLLRHVLFVKVIDDGEEFEFRICGEAHLNVTGFRMQGCQIRDLKRVAPSVANSVRALYTRVRSRPSAHGSARRAG